MDFIEQQSVTEILPDVGHQQHKEFDPTASLADVLKELPWGLVWTTRSLYQVAFKDGIPRVGWVEVTKPNMNQCWVER